MGFADERRDVRQERKEGVCFQLEELQVGVALSHEDGKASLGCDWSMSGE